jgi:enoyl-CoA hydratase/carnithine racemase
MNGLVQEKKHGSSGTIILNRPEKRNALSRALIEELRQALQDFLGERSVRVVILAGAGSAFCAGMDLQEMHETSKRQNPHPQWYEDAVMYRDLMHLMLEYPKPIIAAVNGPAVAGGAGLVLASDLVVAAKEAAFGLPEPKRGVVAGMVAPLLFFRVGGSHSANLLLTGRIIDSAEAHRIGVFHEVVANDLVWARANEIAQECSRSAPEALQLTKQMLNQTVGEQLETLLTAGAAISATARTTEAAQEGVAAFLEKREPHWK